MILKFTPSQCPNSLKYELHVFGASGAFREATATVVTDDATQTGDKITKLLNGKEDRPLLPLGFKE